MEGFLVIIGISILLSLTCIGGMLHSLNTNLILIGKLLEKRK